MAAARWHNSTARMDDCQRPGRPAVKWRYVAARRVVTLGRVSGEREKPPSRIPQSAAAVAGGVVGWRLGPAGALAGAAAGPYLVDFARQVWDEVTPDAQRRQGEMLGAAAEAGAQELEGLADMIGRSERTRLMAGIAMTGTARTAWPPKVYGLGRALADGLIAADEAQINLADLVLPVMTDMDRPHVSLLELLVR
jgi:hypothetical protein